jgi:nitrite reductase (NO-forming)
MKILKLIAIITLTTVFVSCGNSEKKSTTTTPKVEQPETMSSNEGTTTTSEEGSLASKMESGKAIYLRTCVACHQANGAGIPNAFPPLAESDYLNADVDRAIDIVLNGKSGEISVNGTTYNSAMTKQDISSSEVADVLTYVYNSWDNNKTEVTTAQVEKIKKNI